MSDFGYESYLRTTGSLSGDLAKAAGREWPPVEVSQKASATKLAKLLGTSAADVQQQLIQLGYISSERGWHKLTELGVSVGGEHQRHHPTDDGFFVWPVDVVKPQLKKQQ